MEEWRPIPGHDGYEVSNYGRVRSWKGPGNSSALREIPFIRKIKFNRNGYAYVQLVEKQHEKNCEVHRLVGIAFVEKTDPLLTEVCHRDGNRQNNLFSNLYWGTKSRNSLDAVLHGGMKIGQDHVFSKLTQADVDEIRASSATGAELARAYGVSDATVSLLRRFKTWKGKEHSRSVRGDK